MINNSKGRFFQTKLSVIFTLFVTQSMNKSFQFYVAVVFLFLLEQS